MLIWWEFSCVPFVLVPLSSWLFRSDVIPSLSQNVSNQILRLFHAISCCHSAAIFISFFSSFVAIVVSGMLLKTRQWQWRQSTNMMNIGINISKYILFSFLFSMKKYFRKKLEEFSCARMSLTLIKILFQVIKWRNGDLSNGFWVGRLRLQKLKFSFLKVLCNHSGSLSLKLRFFLPNDEFFIKYISFSFIMRTLSILKTTISTVMKNFENFISSNCLHNK